MKLKMNHYYINDLMKTINFKKKRFFSPDMKCEGLQQLCKINENNLNCEESKSTQISQCKISKSINSTTKNKDETNSIDSNELTKSNLKIKNFVRRISLFNKKLKDKNNTSQNSIKECQPMYDHNIMNSNKRCKVFKLGSESDLVDLDKKIKTLRENDKDIDLTLPNIQSENTLCCNISKEETLNLKSNHNIASPICDSLNKSKVQFISQTDYKRL